MKKAKIFLGAIAVFAIAGGALAFKAENSSLGFSVFTCYTPVTGGPFCSISADENGDPIKFTNVGLGRLHVIQITSDPMAYGQPCILNCTDEFTLSIKPE